ncbi:MAG: trimethylamine methyltransferase family protein, partial [Roseibium sp.]
MTDAPSRTRKRERTRKRSDSGSTARKIKQAEWRRLRSPYPPMGIVSEDELEAIHTASLRILSDIGIDFLDETARGVLKQHGADVEKGSERVRFDPDMILQYVAKAPSEFTLHGGRPERDLVFGGNNLNFASIASAPFCSDLEGGRRDGNYADFQNFVRMGQTANIIHLFGGYPVEPVDLPPQTRHLDCHYSFLTLSDKVHHAYSLGRQRPSDAIDMLCIARGETRDSIVERPGMHSIINTSSPLRVDIPMLQGLTEMSSHGQAI